ncbi:MAG: HEPN domain-containing protein [Patescibacteria group bacterium]
MKSTVKKWVEFVDNDIKVANLLFKHGQKMGFAYQATVFHCHQAIEKMLKAILTDQGKEAPKIHNLVRLLALTGLNIKSEIKDVVENINPHYLPPRYPDMQFKSAFSFVYNSKSVERIIKATLDTILCLKEELK